MCILDVSKSLMHRFHYDYIEPKYRMVIKLSNCLQIRTPYAIILLLKIIIKIQLMMLRNSLTLVITKQNTQLLLNMVIKLVATKRS
jgi:hypothetical protein